MVEESVILELKSVQRLTPVMEAQILNYLRLSVVPMGSLVNFNGERYGGGTLYKTLVCSKIDLINLSLTYVGLQGNFYNIIAYFDSNSCSNINDEITVPSGRLRDVLPLSPQSH